MAKKLELTWIGSLKQWRKQRQGKRYYLGSGDYQTALKRWRLKEAALIQSEAVEWRDEETEAYESGLSAMRSIKVDAPTAGPAAKFFGWDKPTETEKPKNKTFSEIMADYVDHQKRRYEHGKMFPNAPKSERMSGGRYRAYQQNMKHLQKLAGTIALPNEGDLYQFFKRFRDDQQDLLSKKEITAHTFNERMKLVSNFVKWMYEGYMIPAVPRGFAKLSARYATESTARALDVKLVRRLFENAPPKLKTFIALALNCCFYASDIAHLKASDIQGDYIAIDRHKTGIYAKYRLWDVTKRLLEENANKQGMAFDQLLTFSDKQQRQSKIDNLLFVLKRSLKLKKISFSNFRDTTSTMVEGIDRTITDIVLAHKDNRMAAYYVDKRAYDGSELQRKVDNVILKVGELLGM